MVKNIKDGLLRVFWPDNLARQSTTGVVVGWRNADLDFFVVTIIEGAEFRDVEAALRVGTLFRGSPYPVARIFQLCERPSMLALGKINNGEPPQPFDASSLQFSLLPGSRDLQLYCPTSVGLSVQIVFFDAPNPGLLEYMSLKPIDLILGHILQNGTHQNQLDIGDEREQRRRAKMMSKLKYHTVIRHQSTQRENALPAILQQINCAQELNELIQKNVSLVGAHRKRSLSMSERMVESAQDLYALTAWSVWNLFVAYVSPLLFQTFRLVIIMHRIVAEGILLCLEWRLPILRPFQLPDSTGMSTERLALKDISACCQQVHLRLQQFSYYPTQYALLRKRKANWSSIPSTNADYIRFYNSLWLVANDVIIGIALGSFINENAQTTAVVLEDVLSGYTIDGLKRMIRWLMSYPGGLKLNTELAAFLGDLFLWVIEYWAATTSLLVTPHLPTIIYIIGVSSFAGASMPIAIFSDLVSLLTLHIYSFYIASARIFNWQLTIIVSLFHLFRGKKRNVLRNRIDSCDYDLDQLLLGTILFTLLFFLLPTVVVFYLTFASARMAIITLKATLDTCLACLNHFPLFAIMLRIKDSRRLPGGVTFELLPSKSGFRMANPTVMVYDTDETTMTPPSYIRLSSTPLSMRQIFAQYFQLGFRIRKHYLSADVLLRLLSGRFVPPLGRREMYGMQYSALPRERISIGQVWKELAASPEAVLSTLPKQARRDGYGENLGIFGQGIGKRWRHQSH